MRRDGLLTGYVWNKNAQEKVKVKAKPTNASKSSGRCARAKCSRCHAWPVSKARSKSKGRNKRSWSRALIDDEWAFCKCTAASGLRAKADPTGLCHVDYGGGIFTFAPFDAYRSDTGPFGHDDFDDAAYAAPDACCISDAFNAYPADANPPRHGVKGDVLDTHCADKINVAGDVGNPGMHGRVDIKDIGTLMHAVTGSESKLYLPSSAAHAAKNLAPILNYTGIHAVATDTLVFGDADDVDDDADDVDDDASCGSLSAAAHAENNVAKGYEEAASDSNANAESQAINVHAAENVSNDDNTDTYVDEDDQYSTKDADDLLSLISVLTDGKWPPYDSDDLSEDESEVDSLGGDWFYVASFPGTADDIPDIGDDWCLC